MTSQGTKNINNNTQTQVYVFFRSEGFYPLELRDDDEAIKNAVHNSGTLQVIRAMDEVVIWKQPEALA